MNLTEILKEINDEIVVCDKEEKDSGSDYRESSYWQGRASGLLYVRKFIRPMKGCG